MSEKTGNAANEQVAGNEAWDDIAAQILLGNTGEEAALRTKAESLYDLITGASSYEQAIQWLMDTLRGREIGTAEAIRDVTKEWEEIRT
jgi:hypothetical protein